MRVLGQKPDCCSVDNSQDVNSWALCAGGQKSLQKLQFIQTLQNERRADANAVSPPWPHLFLFVWNSNRGRVTLHTFAKFNWFFFLLFLFITLLIKHIILRAEGNEAEVNLGGVHSLCSHAEPVEKLGLSVIPANVLVSPWRKAAFLGSFSAWRCESGKRAEKQVPDW